MGDSNDSMMINKAHTTGTITMLHDPKAARCEDSKKDPGTAPARDRSDSWASETDADDFDLHQGYQNAIDCLKQCETIISSLQDELTSKEAHIATLEGRPLERIISTIQDQLSTKNDELASKDEKIAELLELIREEDFKDKHIASLEERLVAMSLELASAKAIEDEHRLLKRRISNASMSDDNFSAHSGVNIVERGSLCSSNSHHSSDNKVVQQEATPKSSARRIFGRRATTDELVWRNLSLPLSRQFGKAERRASTGGSSASSPLPQHSWHCRNMLTKDMDGPNSSSIPLPHNSWHGRKFLTKEDHATADVGYQPKSQRRSRATQGHSRSTSPASSSPPEQQETHGADFSSVDFSSVTATAVETKHQPAATTIQTNLSLPLSRQFGKAERRASTGGSASSPLPQHSWHCSRNSLAKDMDQPNSSSIPLPHNSWHGRKFLTKEDHTTADVGYQPKSQRRSRSTKGHLRSTSLASSSPSEQQETHGADFSSVDFSSVTATAVETKHQPAATTSRLQRRRSSRSDHSRRSDLSSSLPVTSQYDADDFHVSTGSLDVDFLDQSEKRYWDSTFDEQAIDALLNDTSSKQSSNSIGRFLRNLSSSVLLQDAIADDLQSVERMVDNDYKLSFDDSSDASVEARRRGNSDGCIDTISASKTHTISRAQARPSRPRHPNRRQSMDSAINNGPRSNNPGGPRSNNPGSSMNNIGRMLRRTFSQSMLCDVEANSGLQSKHTSHGNLVGISTNRGGQTANQYIENALHNQRNRNHRPSTRRRMGTDGVLISSLKSSSSTIPGVVFPSTFEEVIDKGCLELGDSLKMNEVNFR